MVLGCMSREEAKATVDYLGLRCRGCALRWRSFRLWWRLLVSRCAFLSLAYFNC